MPGLKLFHLLSGVRFGVALDLQYLAKALQGQSFLGYSLLLTADRCEGHPSF